MAPRVHMACRYSHSFFLPDLQLTCLRPIQGHSPCHSVSDSTARREGTQDTEEEHPSSYVDRSFPQMKGCGMDPIHVYPVLEEP